MQIVQRAIQRQVHRLLGMEGRGGNPRPPDPGPPFFPPDAVCRDVHRDFVTMLVGGVTALLLQMLHPKALAGVWDHSNFRDDMPGRLRRTAAFISGTTYGSLAEAERLIGRVRAIHDQVHGVLPDGTSYSANDPALLAWVHAAGAWSFLEAHMRYRNPVLGRAQQDLYFAETAVTARRLGAHPVPETRAELEAYIHSVRPQLRCDERTREVARVILSSPAPTLLLEPARGLVVQGAINLLPDWARAMHGLYLPDWQRPALRSGIHALGKLTRWGLSRGRAEKPQEERS